MQDAFDHLQDLYWTRGEVSGFRASLKGRDSREPIRVVWLADPKWQDLNSVGLNN